MTREQEMAQQLIADFFDNPKRPNPFRWDGTQEEFDKAMDDYEACRDARNPSENKTVPTEHDKPTRGQGRAVCENNPKDYSPGRPQLFDDEPFRDEEECEHRYGR